MAKDNGKCGANCNCPAGTCAKENGSKCGANCDCAAGTCQGEWRKVRCKLQLPCRTCGKE